METVSFPYVIAGAARKLDLSVVGEYVLARPIAEALALRWAKCKLEMELVELPEGSGATVPVLARWLASLDLKASRIPVVMKHFQDHLVPTLENRSVSLKAAEATKKVQQEVEKSRVITVDHPLDGTDRYRRDASTGVNRLNPELINLTARAGSLDLFVLNRGIFDDSETFEHMSVTTLPSAYREGIVKDLARNYEQILTAPEMLLRHPESFPMRRPVVPAHREVREIDGKLRAVLIPETVGRFPWEAFV